METEKNEYHISFFRPGSPRAKANRNLTLFLVIIWALAVFGFQLALKFLEKPVPEPTLLSFEEVWGNVQDNTATTAQMQQFAQANLNVLSKVFIAPKHREVLGNALSYAYAQLVDAENNPTVYKEMDQFQEMCSIITDIKDPKYVKERDRLGREICTILAIPAGDLRVSIAPLEIKTEWMNELSPQTRAQLPLVMETYLIHNQSVLTDTIVLGFPFHYFYTSVLLLILFVGLCLMYCLRTDAIHKKLGIDANM